MQKIDFEVDGKIEKIYNNFTEMLQECEKLILEKVKEEKMKNIIKKIRRNGIALLLFLFVAGVSMHTSASDVQAATAGFKTINGKTYYIKSDGSKQKGWLTLSGKKYYFNKSTGVQVKGWLTDSNGNKRYFTKNKGVMATGWMSDSKGNKRYFDSTTGIMKTKWLTLNGKKYYLYKNSGIAATGFVKTSSGKCRYFHATKCYMRTGWLTNSKGQKRYFSTSSSNLGIMATGFSKISGKYYYFNKSNGIMKTGWITSSSTGKKRYFNTNTGVMVTGIVTIAGKKYEFNTSTGYLIGEVQEVTTGTATSSKTIKNYLLGALQPVGKALYVWGGGWNDSTRKGVSPTWEDWYEDQSSSYNFNNYRDLSVSTRAKGLDCSGFVGWAAYQVMQKKSGVGSGYTVVAAEVGSYYQRLGWGKVISQKELAADNYTLKPGDVGFNEGHTWIVLGQCSDKSVVIVHSTPNAGCQIAGTCTPEGNYDSEAIALAKKYMSKYSGFKKYEYHTSCGNYIRNGRYFRWNSSTLSDPNGYKNKKAAAILADLYKS